MRPFFFEAFPQAIRRTPGTEPAGRTSVIPEHAPCGHVRCTAGGSYITQGWRMVLANQRADGNNAPVEKVPMLPPFQ